MDPKQAEKSWVQKERNRFSFVARMKSFSHAWRGIGILIKTSHNAWVGIFVGSLVVFLGLSLDISNLEWLFIVFAIGLVSVAEGFNTAFEIDIDLTSPEYHPYAKDTKDVAAGAVLLSLIFAVVVVLFVFLPRVL